MVAFSKVILVNIILGCCLLGNRCSQVGISTSSCKSVIIKNNKADNNELLEPVDKLILIRLNG